MKFNSFYSYPLGKVVPVADVAAVVLNQSGDDEDHYYRLANLFPLVGPFVDTRLRHFLNNTQVAFERDCGPGETKALHGGITTHFDPADTTIPAPVLDLCQRVRFSTAELFGRGTQYPTLDLFLSQRSLHATPGVSISCLPHIDNEIDTAREFGVISAVANVLNVTACRKYRIRPGQFGMFFYDHRKIPFDAYRGMATRFHSDDRQLTAEDQQMLDAAGGWPLPVNRLCLASDALFHSGRCYTQRRALKPDADIGHISAINMELRFRTAIASTDGRLRGIDPDQLKIA